MYTGRMGRDEPTAGARISREAMDAIEAAAFVRATSMQGILRPAIESFAADLSQDRAVQAALDAREMAKTSQGQVEPATVTKLRP